MDIKFNLIKFFLQFKFNNDFNFSIDIYNSITGCIF